MTALPTVRAGRDAVRRDPLVRHGLRVLHAGQSASGALIASSNLGAYRFAWLRDGAFCALALSVAGRPDAADAFHCWAARTVLAHRDVVDAAVRAVREGQPEPPHLPTRYTLGGEHEADPDRAWHTFQLDGYGTWLWTVAAHTGRRELPPVVARAVRVVADYLAAMWNQPCYSCWEEFGDGHHTSTLLAVAAGLAAAARLADEEAFAECADQITAAVRAEYTVDGQLAKGRTDARVDASLLWAGAPFHLPAVTDTPLLPATVRAVHADLLVPDGGVRRYLGDRYYGGGQWPLLTSWLGWHAVRTGDRALAEHCDRWVRAQATAGGDLPEQATGNPQAPDMVPHWIDRRGPVATPLLWSHAMQIVHAAAMTEAGWSAAG